MEPTAAAAPSGTAIREERQPPGSGRLEQGAHFFPVRVYYEDTDGAGIVYFANYLKFAERARTELLRLIGRDHTTLRTRDGIVFVVRTLEAAYHRPARLDDFLEVETRLLELRGASMQMQQKVLLRGSAMAEAAPKTAGSAEEALVTMQVGLACITPDGRPTRWPAEVKSAMAALVVA